MKKFVIIRTCSAGVHFGILETKEYTPAGTIVLLSDAQRVYYWSGAASLSQMANDGVKNPLHCKFSQVVKSIELIAIEIIETTEIAEKNLREVKIWKV
jgi:hypothetical protein